MCWARLTQSFLFFSLLPSFIIGCYKVQAVKKSTGFSAPKKMMFLSTKLYYLRCLQMYFSSMHEKLLSCYHLLVNLKRHFYINIHYFKRKGKSAESGRRIEMGWVNFGRLRQNAGQKGFLAGIKWICNQSPSNLPPSLQPPLSFFQNLPYSFLPISDSNQHPSPISPTELKKNRIIQEKKKRKKKRMRKQRLRHCTKILPDKIPCAG